MLIKITRYDDLDERGLMDVYAESNSENAEEFYPELTDRQEAVEQVEAGFLEYLRSDFFTRPAAAYWIWEEGGTYVSALRICRVEGTLCYLEALETRPNRRGRGYATRLLSGVLQRMRQEGPFRLCDCIYKKNTVSIKTHVKCGFQIASDEGYDYLRGEADDRDYSMEYRYEGE